MHTDGPKREQAAAIEARLTPQRRGRRRSAEREGLPPGMIARVRTGGTHYYLSRSVRSQREEIPLGKNLPQALADYKALLKKPVPGQRAVTERPWLAKDLYDACRKRAKRRGLTFELELADVDAMLVKSRGRCMLTGIKFHLGRADGERRRLWAPSIDRIDSKQGYTSSNVRLIACAVNIALNDFGEELMVQIARALLRQRRARL